MGGLAKGCDFQDLSAPVRKICKKIIAIGEAAGEISAVLGPVCPGGVDKAITMEDAVARAFYHAVSGDTVLLSPACASFDFVRRFRNSEQQTGKKNKQPESCLI